MPVTVNYFEIVVFTDVSIRMFEVEKNVEQLVIVLSIVQIFVINESLFSQSSGPDLVGRQLG